MPIDPPRTTSAAALWQSARHVHFVGIGGVGMSGLARAARRLGRTVSGSDSTATALTQALIDEGMRVSYGHRAEHSVGADLVVITAAVRPDNPEVISATQAGTPIVTRAELLGHLVRNERTIGVAGTHGKTTTSAMLALILHRAGISPTAFIGGDIIDLNDSNCLLGAHLDTGEGWAVVEADEYAASFWQLWPEIAVVTNIEPDHLDIYGTVAALHDAFAIYLSHIPAKGLAVLNIDDPVLRGLAEHVTARVIGYSLGSLTVDYPLWRASAVQVAPQAVSATILTPQGHSYALRLSAGGRHTLANAVAALAASAEVGVDMDIALAALAEFRGARRRQECIGVHQVDSGDAVIYDDYAHHPTEIRATLSALRQRFPDRRLRCVFQPHTYSRTRDLFDDFTHAFADAWEIVLTDIYAAREQDTLGMSGGLLAEATAHCHPRVHYLATVATALAYLDSTAQAGDLLVTMGAGDIGQAGRTLWMTRS